MKREHVQLLMRRIGSERISMGTDWVRGTCPLARWRHPKGRDRHPSFAISVDPKGDSVARCLACGYKGKLIPLLWALEVRGVDISAMAPFVYRYDQPDLDRNEPPTLSERLKATSNYLLPPNPAGNKSNFKIREQATLPESDLDQFRNIPMHIRKHLLEDRGLLPGSIDAWELGFNAEHNRLVVPIRARGGSLVALSGRAMYETRAKYLHSKGFKRDLTLYGEHMIKPGGRGYLHEGFFSVIYAWQYGYHNSLARMGTHLSGVQASKLVDWFDELMVVPDGDKAGFESAAEIQEMMQHRIPTSVAPMPAGKEVDKLSPDELREVMGMPESLVDTVSAAH